MKVCVVTGTRAEYGLLYWLMKELEEDSELELQLVVTGMHLSVEFGYTVQQIEKDGFAIDRRVEMLLSSDTDVGVAKSVGLGVISFADIFAQLQPDYVVVLGDRYEILAAAQAAFFLRIPIAHLHGGEVTVGAMDESIRHAITKLSHLHFTAAEPYRERVMQLGENPGHIHTVGAPGLENLRRTPTMSKKELEASLGFEWRNPSFLVTYHPITLMRDGVGVEPLLEALDSFPEAGIIFTKANSDSGGREINQRIRTYVSSRKHAVLVSSLHSELYINAMKHADVVIGNSSSGLIETPYFRTPSVNIGDRQQGRLKAKSVIDCENKTEEIVRSIKQALSPAFRQGLRTMEIPYGDGNTASKIINVLKQTDLSKLIVKPFFDRERKGDSD
ncbi:UDP-N-acetylglucosamine 2-epimerase [Thalassobacillus hwangdonensis]|uniref:UDP-N-acetylglucosamine 2-epimerase n=1 Tax=Thalassobacillus hwangdonensis TaxID=546108 RepID=A0ABW3L574_9BACI